jgi:hypothetical protein
VLGEFDSGGAFDFDFELFFALSLVLLLFMPLVSFAASPSSR